MSALAGAPPAADRAVWWNVRRIVAAAAVAALIGLFAFLFRFNTLGGAFGGFDNDHFVHLVRSDMLLHGEQPLRDFADAELRGAWPSLGYAATAWAQQMWGRSLLVEAYLTVGGLALATAIVFLLALALSRRWLVSTLAAACVIATAPKLYNYEKVLILAVAALLIHAWIVKPTATRLVGLSACTAIATLFRHDFGIYLAIASAAALLAHGPAPVSVRLRRTGMYAALTMLLLTPSIAWVQAYQGVVPYVERSLATITGESSRTGLEWPTLDIMAGADARNLISLAYYAFWSIPLAAAIAMTIRAFRGGPLDERARAIGFSFLMFAASVNASFLRGNLNARLGDAVVPVVLLAAWMTTLGPALPSVRRVGTALLWATPRLLLAIIIACTFVTTEAALELDSGGFSDSWAKVTRRFRVVRTDLAQLPPQSWTGVATAGTMAAARYIAECTAPGDRILLATYVPEVLVLGRRLFAAGQGTFGLNFYLSDEQQLEAVARLRQQSVPVILASHVDFEGEFVHDYRRVFEYVSSHYRDAGTIAIDGEPRLRVLVETRRPVRSLDPVSGLPCFQ